MKIDWRVGGLALGLVFFLAVLLVKPIGVSTQFTILSGIFWDLIDPQFVTQTSVNEYTSTNAHLDKSGGKYAANIANPLNYSFIFVLAMMMGGFLSAYIRDGIPKPDSTVPEIWRENFGNSAALRYGVAFVGGFIVLFGARLAGGCTSGHMMSGMMQTALSGYIFAAGAFLSAIPTALFMFCKGT